MQEDAKAEDSRPDKVISTMPVLNKEISIQDQSSRMPLRKILIVYLGIGLALMISFMDQTAVTTAAPKIGSDINGSATISWLGTSYLVGNCAFQLVYGRLSDIFGRKNMLQTALCFLIIGNILCSFAKTPIQLYAFRAISGIGGGGINNIAMVIVSDIVPLVERGKYQGLISAATSTGNAIGPFVGGGLAGANQWRWLFRVVAISGAITVGLIHFIIPLKPVTGSVRQKLLQVDYAGVLLSSTSILFLLIPISGGGVSFPWSSGVVISLLCIGTVCGMLFLLVEGKFSKLPILPLRLFLLRTPCIISVQSFFIGMIYFGNQFYVPTFFQYVKGYSPLMSGALVLSYTIPQALWGIGAGFYITKTNHYRRVIVVGAAIWLLASGLQILWRQSTHLAMAIGFLEIGAIGIGFDLQTTLVAALATSPAKDRAVVTASRNFFRTMGGAFGLASANAIYQATITTAFALIKTLSNSEKTLLLDSSASQKAEVSAEGLSDARDAYSKGLKMVFVAFTVFAAMSFLLSLFIEEVTFAKDKPAPSDTSSDENQVLPVSPIDETKLSTVTIPSTMTDVEKGVVAKTAR
ncbi:uncharacterized protein I303_103264 [Kwoniella dejecticola CBS 10117]|uniref:Major facilitator superfamily (MFS) profile domain-containing protein n=1 Tax=Kwoniella dejecticola CBS 10117 TaxID=1296121 RepID=A0A1A6AB29_9TREE|nr:uncharacterized protein I303_03287 [Kwoniella dejecticola CBS 10117]OBR87262.1 hypothetical protein I303_03287 [Kwoniella dejecticola CBS 10117]